MIKYSPSTFLLLVAVPTMVHATTLESCVGCFLEFPEAYLKGLINSDCKWSDCGWGQDDEETNFVDCGCDEFMQPVFDCFEDCSPGCLNTTISEYDQCLHDNAKDCGRSCLEEIIDIVIPEANGTNISDAVEWVSDAIDKVDLNLTLPDCDGNFLEKLFNDPLDCLYPVFPVCDDVQEQIVDPTCKATSCCDECATEFASMQECAYNWISGYNCSFSCPSTTRRLGDSNNRKFVANQMHEVMLRHEQGKDISVAVHHQNRRLDYTETCRSQLEVDVVANPLTAMESFSNCITIGALETTVAEGVTAVLNNLNSGDDDDDNNGNDDDDDDDNNGNDDDDDNSGNDDDDDDDNGGTSGAAFKSIFWASVATAVASFLVM